MAEVSGKLKHKIKQAHLKKVKAKQRIVAHQQRESSRLYWSGLFFGGLLGLSEATGTLSKIQTYDESLLLAPKSKPELNQAKPKTTITKANIPSTELSTFVHSPITRDLTNNPSLLAQCEAPKSCIAPDVPKDYENFVALAKEFRTPSGVEARLQKFRIREEQISKQSLFGKLFNPIKSLFNASKELFNATKEKKPSFEIYLYNEWGQFLIKKGPNFKKANCSKTPVYGSKTPVSLEFQISVEFIKQNQAYFDWVDEYSVHYQNGGYSTPFFSSYNVERPEYPYIIQKEELRRLGLKDCMNVNDPETASIRQMKDRLNNAKKELRKQSEVAQTRTNEALECIEQTLAQGPQDNGGVLHQGHNNISPNCAMMRFLPERFLTSADSSSIYLDDPNPCSEAISHARETAKREEEITNEVSASDSTFHRSCYAYRKDICVRI